MESFKLPNFERGKEHSDGRYNTFTRWSCPTIGRMYRLLRNSTPKPRHSGPAGIAVLAARYRIQDANINTD